jgi:hypothetical protein
MSNRRNAAAPAGQWNYWAALLGASLVATLVPWYLGVLDIDVRPTLRALLTGGALALALMQLNLVKRDDWVAAIPHVLGVAVLAAAWYWLGAFAVTGFLILFAVPTYAVALAGGRWTVASIATLTVAAASAAALAASPELRWQLYQVDALAALLPASLQTPGDGLRFTSSAAGREQLATLAVFAATIFAVAGVGSSAAAVIRRQALALQRTDRAQRESASLVSKLLDDGAAIEAIVFPVSGRLHSVNRAFRETFGDAGGGATLIERLRPIYPEALERLLATARGGELAAQGCMPQGQRWLLDAALQPVVLEGEPMWRVRLRRTAPNDLLAAAIAALGPAVLVLAPDKTVAFATDAFRLRFPRAAEGQTAADSLDDLHGLPARWWDIAPSTRSNVRFRHEGTRYTAKIVLTGTHADSSLTSIELAAEAST